MHRLFKTSHAYLYPTLRSPKSLIPISHLHNPTKTQDPNLKPGFIFDEVEGLQSSKPTNQITQSSSETSEISDFGLQTKVKNESRVQISHPWPEWVDLMGCLLKRGYFDADGNPIGNSELGFKESNHIRTACLNFARDRHSLIRYLSRKDIQVIAGCGCPSIDRKVVNSGKRLRAHVGIHERNACSSCNLRGNCERAYVKVREDEGGRTVDVMRILLTYGLDPITGTVDNKPCQTKIVIESVRRLLKEMVEYSMKELDSDLSKAPLLKVYASNSQEKGDIEVPMKQGDWHCPKCNFLNFARNFKCLRCDGLFHERLRQLREDQDHLPLKKGDWICEKCSFLNFAKNTRCLQCQEKPPKRQLNPGEWECESCNYVNFRRNMVCLKCDHRRPKASNASNASAQPQHDSGGFSNRNRNGLRFVNSENEADPRKSVRRELGRSKSQNRGSDMWRFVEEESEDQDGSISWNEDSGFVDFPIEGGKSALSDNMQKREKWKLKMLERRKSAAAGTRENEDETRSAYSQRRLELLESTDDEEMTDWFGHR